MASAARQSLRLPPQALLGRSAPDTLFRLALLNEINRVHRDIAQLTVTR